MKVSDLDQSRNVVALYEPIILTGPDGWVRTKAKIDTAATESNISKVALEQIGRSEYRGESTVNVGSSKEDRDTYKVTVDLENIEEARLVVEVNEKDRSGFTGNFLIAKDLLEEFDFAIDPLADNFDGGDDVEEIRENKKAV